MFTIEQIHSLNDEIVAAIASLESVTQNNTQHINTDQTGVGMQTHSSLSLDLTAPNFGLSDNDIAQLVRNGGVVDDYSVVPRSRFNSIVLHRTLNLRNAPSTDMASYATSIHNMLSDVVSFSRVLGGDGSVIDITLRGSSLTSDVNALFSTGYTE